MTFSKLTWGVKASFRGYVEAAGGAVNVSDGATRDDDGSFVFSAVPGGDLAIGSDGTATGSMRFEGTVNFNAHGGMLNSTLTELGLEVGANGGLVLTALALNQDRCEIAELTFLESGSDGAVTLRSEITLDGMYQIADNYPPGTELDPLHLD